MAQPSRRLTRVRRLLVLSALAAVFPTAAAQAARPLELGLTDNAFQASDDATRNLWLDRAKDSRADVVLLGAVWPQIAPSTRPPDFNPADPGDPAYRWEMLDAAVRAASARGLTVMISIYQAPGWAEGADHPGTAGGGTWRPDPTEIANFSRALAARYSGSFADPANPAVALPAVRRWQLWAEPNLTNLMPQWEGKSPVSPHHYRAMLNAFYGAMKSVSTANLVVTGGTGPYGDPSGVGRMRPLRFWRELLCLRGRRLRRTECPAPAHFDVLAHHPINAGPPRRSALNASDVTTPDVHKLRRVVRRAVRVGTALPQRRKQLWATEFWWQSRPPDPNGVSARRHARFLQEALYLLWRQRVETAIWFQIRDPATIDTGSSFETGLFFQDGAPKLAYRAFRFPFVTEAIGKRRQARVRAWGKAPSPGSVVIQTKRRGRWRNLKRIRAGGNKVFLASLRLRRPATLRAIAGGESSLPWHQR